MEWTVFKEVQMANEHIKNVQHPQPLWKCKSKLQ
jgi:hypothetical protein